MSKLREGDIAIFQVDSGGTIQVLNGEPEMDGGLESAVYLSLFGNDSSDYWANEYFTEDQKLTGFFIGFMLANPKTIATLNQAEEFALQDLQWFINSGIADTVDVTITSPSRQRIDLTVELKIDGDTLFQNTFQVNWGFQINDPAHNRAAQPESEQEFNFLVTDDELILIGSNSDIFTVD